MPLFVVEYLTSPRAFARTELLVGAESVEAVSAEARKCFADVCAQYPKRPPRGVRIRDSNLEVVRPFQPEAPKFFFDADHEGLRGRTLPRDGAMMDRRRL